MQPKLPPLTMSQAEILYLGYAIQEEKRAAGEEPCFTVAEVDAKRPSLTLADRVHIRRIRDQSHA